jgi:hypothetical protein
VKSNAPDASLLVRQECRAACETTECSEQGASSKVRPLFIEATVPSTTRTPRRTSADHASTTDPKRFQPARNDDTQRQEILSTGPRRFQPACAQDNEQQEHRLVRLQRRPSLSSVKHVRPQHQQPRTAAQPRRARRNDGDHIQLRQTLRFSLPRNRLQLPLPAVLSPSLPVGSRGHARCHRRSSHRLTIQAASRPGLHVLRDQPPSKRDAVLTLPTRHRLAECREAVAALRHVAPGSRAPTALLANWRGKHVVHGRQGRRGELGRRRGSGHFEDCFREQVVERSSADLLYQPCPEHRAEFGEQRVPVWTEVGVMEWLMWRDRRRTGDVSSLRCSTETSGQTSQCPVGKTGGHWAIFLRTKTGTRKDTARTRFKAACLIVTILGNDR